MTTVKPLTLSTLDEAAPFVGEDQDTMMGRQLTEQWAKVVGGQREQLIFGAMMLKLRARVVGSARGANSATRGPSTKGTGLKGWLQDHAPKVSESTAYRLMDIAEGVAEEFKLGKKMSLEALLAAQVDTLDEKLAKKRAEIEQCIAGQSQRQLLLTFGKEKARVGGKTYERDGEKGQRGQDTPQQAAIDLWTPILRGLVVEGLQEKSWIDLPNMGKVSRESLAGVLLDLGKALKEAKR